MAYKATETRLDPQTRATLEGSVRAKETEQRYVNVTTGRVIAKHEKRTRQILDGPEGRRG